ncbi:MAG: hypothetical protein U0869_11680 [Chloroflexota bacterium]
MQAAYAAGTRSADGNPGPNYRQNSSVHDIQLTVMLPDWATIHATQTITYTNNAPSSWRRSRSGCTRNPSPHRNAREGVPAGVPDRRHHHRSVQGQRPGRAVHPDLARSGETHQDVPLPEPIPAGGRATFDIAWHFDLAQFPVKEGVIDPTATSSPTSSRASAPSATTRRRPSASTGTTTRRSSPTWPGRELNNDFADFNVSVTVPKDFAVWATGELQNPDEVLRADAAKKYADSLTSAIDASPSPRPPSWRPASSPPRRTRSPGSGRPRT